MRYLNFPLIKLCLGFITGIYLGFLNIIDLASLIITVITLSTLLLFIYRKYHLKTVFLISSILLFICLGSITTYFHLPSNQPQHIVHSEYLNDRIVKVSARIKEELRPNTNHYKYILDEISINDSVFQGKILWNVSRDIKDSDLDIGENILLFSPLKDFQKSSNPQSFDYRAFMFNRNVYRVIYEDGFIKLPQSSFDLSIYGARQRAKIVGALKKAGFKEAHLQFIQALILGQKKAINRETYNDFAEVGVVHILAVSGLHVGIVLIIIQFLLKPLLRIPKYGRPVMILLSILSLWFFAALAGFSPSVMRASTMFSFLALSQLSRRKTNSLNMLGLSAVVLLLFKPQLLFEVGFQLSYAAVFAIVLLYPVFSKVYLPTYNLPKIFIKTAYVSLAAQIGVLPFQLYYFHQFPGLFLVGNIVIVPFLGLLLSGGIVCIVLSLLGWLPKFFVSAYSFLLDCLVSFVDYLSAFKAFLIQDIFFTKPMFITCLVMVVLFMLMIREFKSKQMISAFLISVLIFSMTSIQEVFGITQKSEFIVFHQPKSTIIGVKNKDKLTVFSNSLEINETDYWLKNYRTLNRIKEVKFKKGHNIFNYGNQQIFMIDSSGVYTSDSRAEIFLLSGSPDLHFEKFLREVDPHQIIVDAQNYRSYVERWEATASEYGVPFHNTYESGYFSLSLD